MKSQSFVSIGVMSGTSLDGVDLVAIEATPKLNESYSVRSLGHYFKTYPQDWAKIFRTIFEKNQLQEAYYAASAHAEFCSQQIVSFCKKLELTPSQIDVLGVHGQTILHQPAPKKFMGYAVGMTVQLGNPSLIAQRTGITTVGHFRERDITLGGQGAPLVPLGHKLLFGENNKTIVVQNLGGIGNLTLLKSGKVFSSFDTGPGNCWIDAVVMQKTKGAHAYDAQGKFARKGTPNQDVIAKLLAHAYFRKKPPKSTGWEEFGPKSLAPVQKQLKAMKLEDAAATMTWATAKATVQTYENFVLNQGAIDRLVFVGGGAKNDYLMQVFKELLPQTPVMSSSEWGLEVDQIECISFALIAIQTFRGKSGNEPRATGASERAICGEISWGSHASHIDKIKNRLLR